MNAPDKAKLYHSPEEDSTGQVAEIKRLESEETRLQDEIRKAKDKIAEKRQMEELVNEAFAEVINNRAMEMELGREIWLGTAYELLLLLDIQIDVLKQDIEKGTRRTEEIAEELAQKRLAGQPEDQLKSTDSQSREGPTPNLATGDVREASGSGSGSGGKPIATVMRYAPEKKILASSRIQDDDAPRRRKKKNKVTPKNSTPAPTKEEPPQHAMDPTTPLQCICGKSFKADNALQAHIDHYKGKWSVACANCKERFPDQEALIKHTIKLYH